MSSQKKEFLKGYFLISSSALTDPNFNRTVVLLLEHDHQGAFGLVVNRREDIDFFDVIEEELPHNQTEVPLFYGGPVEPQSLFFLHNNPQLVEFPQQKIIEEVFWGNSKDLLLHLLNGSEPFYVFHGYSGWGAGQLEAEILQKSWIVTPAKKEIIFNQDPETMWRTVLEKEGGIFAYFAETVNDPKLN